MSSFLPSKGKVIGISYTQQRKSDALLPSRPTILQNHTDNQIRPCISASSSRNPHKLIIICTLYNP